MIGMGRITLAAAVLAALFAGPSAAQDKSLYERVGGYDARAAVTDDFLAQLETSKDFAPFFVGMSTDTKHRVRQNIVDFFCQAIGGPCFYVGRDMKTVHTGSASPGTSGRSRLASSPTA